MSYAFISDSSCNLPEEIIEELDIEILPLTFMVDDVEHQSYLKGQHTDLKQFFTMMREGKVITTSLPHLNETEKMIRGFLDAGTDVLYVGFSSGLSGTYEATRLLMDQLATEYPDRKLRSIDTLAASGGEGLLVLYAARMRAEGASLEDVLGWVEANRLKLAHWFTVDDLMFLFRGGRVSRTSAWAGTMLSIKPVMHVDDEGHLIPLEKMRGRKKSIKGLFEHMRKTADEPVGEQTVIITHGDCIEDAEYLRQMIEDEWHPREIIINYIDPVIGAHSGPGTLALFFLASSRN